MCISYFDILIDVQGCNTVRSFQSDVFLSDLYLSLLRYLIIIVLSPYTYNIRRYICDSDMLFGILGIVTDTEEMCVSGVCIY